MIENNEIERILEKLENLEDEALAVLLLKEFNQASSALGKLLLNQEWKQLCDDARLRLEAVIKKIEQTT
jgi:hypothetical protein